MNTFGSRAATAAARLATCSAIVPPSLARLPLCTAARRTLATSPPRAAYTAYRLGTDTAPPPAPPLEPARTPEPRLTDPKPRPPRRPLRARKAAIKLTPAAVAQLRALLAQPAPRLIRVGVRNKGCSGLAYHLEYVDAPGALDELVEQDGVRVLVDSRALMSVIGSEMDWVEDKLSQRFVFRNPNIKEQCGCGESFMV